MKMSTVLLALLGLGSCGDANQEAVRHLVVAELIQRERVPESQVEIVSIRFVTQDQAAVEAHILDVATKGSEPARELTCRLERESGRWRVISVRDHTAASP